MNAGGGSLAKLVDADTFSSLDGGGANRMPETGARDLNERAANDLEPRRTCSGDESYDVSTCLLLLCLVRFCGDGEGELSMIFSTQRR